MLEGPDLVSAALGAGASFEALYVDAASQHDEGVASLLRRASDHAVRTFALAPGVLEKVADATTPQPVLACVSAPVVGLEAIEAAGLVLVLHDVRDPGNAGTLIRSADAAGASGVVFSGHSVDPLNPKVLRASAGSIFHLPVVVASLEATLEALRWRGFGVYATVVRDAPSHRDTDLRGPVAVLLGNEAVGLDEASIARCDASLAITMAGSSESLNVGVAGALLAFESLWQRQGTSSPS